MGVFKLLIWYLLVFLSVSLNYIVQKRVTSHTLLPTLSSYEYKNINMHSSTHLINISSLKNVETIKPSWWPSERNTTPLDKLQKMWQNNEALKMTYREEESENISGEPQQIQQQPSMSFYWYKWLGEMSFVMGLSLKVKYVSSNVKIINLFKNTCCAVVITTKLCLM